MDPCSISKPVLMGKGLDKEGDGGEGFTPYFYT